MLSKEKMKRIKRKRRRISLFLIIISLLFSPYMSLYLDQLLTNKFDFSLVKIDYFYSFVSLFHNNNQLMLCLIFEILVLLLLFYLSSFGIDRAKSTATIKVTEQIEIPAAVGQGQHGNSRFMTDKEKEKVFTCVEFFPNKNFTSDKNLGLVLGMERDGKKEKIFCVDDDTNSLIMGTTRSGKTRRLMLQSIFLRSLTGRSMVITDLKGELFIYTHKYLREKGYEVIDIDFRQPNKSKRYNYLQKIIDAVNENDIPRAIDYTWDLVSVMVGVPKGEPLWTNGECSVIAGVILLIAMEAPEQYKNFPNVYAFIANMCKQDEEGKMFITRYFESLDDAHPAKMLFNVAEISPEKMRGSFFGMALTTLRLFTNWNISDITSNSDFSIEEIGKKKTALFIIVPDEKTTFYPLVSLLVNQIYVALVELASKTGGRLPLEVDMLWDEFGNFPEVPSFGSMLSACLSRGIRFTLVVQSFQQIEKKYKDDYHNIKANCNILVYLKTTDEKTLEELSKKTGTYTVESFSASSSVNDYKRYGTNYSSSSNMQSRPLLYPEEIGRIEAPYSIVFCGGHFPAIMYSPDLTEYYANVAFGMGDRAHNNKIFIERDNERPIREIKQIDYWKIWRFYDDYSLIEQKASPDKERISFLS